MPVGEDQQIEVVTEDPKVSSAAGMVNGANPSKDKDFDDFDDALFPMNAPNHEGGRHTNQNRTKGAHPQTPMINNTNNSANGEKEKDLWFKEEEAQRKKLYKIAINQLKNRIAQ